MQFINDYLLGAYKNTGYILQQKARIILWVCGIMLAIIPAIVTQIRSQQQINQQVTSEAGKVMGMAEDIHKAIEEQKLSMNEVVKSVSMLSQITQTYAMGAERLFQNAKNVQSMSEKLNQLIKSET